MNKEAILDTKHPIEKNIDTKLTVLNSTINNIIPVIIQVKNIIFPP